MSAVYSRPCAHPRWCLPAQTINSRPLRLPRHWPAGIPNARFHALTAGSHGGFDILFDELCDAVLKFVGQDASAFAQRAEFSRR